MQVMSDTINTWMCKCIRALFCISMTPGYACASTLSSKTLPCNIASWADVVEPVCDHTLCQLLIVAMLIVTPIVAFMSTSAVVSTHMIVLT